MAHTCSDVFRKRSDDMSTEEHEFSGIRAHLRAIMSALSRLHVVFLSGQPLLFFGRWKDFLMTLCVLDLQTTLSSCVSPREPLESRQASVAQSIPSCAGEKTRCTVEELLVPDHGRLSLILEGRDLNPSQQTCGKQPREAMIS
jgi:hypothetical protein